MSNRAHTTASKARGASLWQKMARQSTPSLQQQAKAARLDAATCLRLPRRQTGRVFGMQVAKNLEEVGYGG